MKVNRNRKAFVLHRLFQEGERIEDPARTVGCIVEKMA